MSTKMMILLGLKGIALTIILFMCFTVAAAVAGLQGNSGETTPKQASATLMALLLVSFLDTLVLTYLILRSRWTGWRLIATVFCVFYGVMTIMAQIESVVFLPHVLPPGLLPKVFLMGAMVAGLFSPLAVVILGKRRPEKVPQVPNSRLVMAKGEWVGKLVAIVVAYLVLYFTFGYFVAWRDPAVRAYYAGVVIPPWLPLFQVVRALLWTALALPVIRMMKGHWWEIGVGVGVLFAVVMNAQLLLPNPYMPETVRMTHLMETASSNFIFGWVIVWLLNRSHASLGELFQWSEGTL